MGFLEFWSLGRRYFPSPLHPFTSSPLHLFTRHRLRSGNFIHVNPQSLQTGFDFWGEGLLIASAEVTGEEALDSRSNGPSNPVRNLASWHGFVPLLRLPNGGTRAVDWVTVRLGGLPGYPTRLDFRMPSPTSQEQVWTLLHTRPMNSHPPVLV